MTKDFSISGIKIGDGYPTYVIAEIGINHNGDEETALRCIDAAVEAKADAVKFQKRHLPCLYPQDLLDHPEKYEQTFQYMIPVLKRVELSKETYVRLKAYCDERDIDFICTPFDTVSADFLQELGVAAFKIASADLTNTQLLQHVAQFGRAMILSTGMSRWQEIERAVSALISVESNFALLHCRSVYPVWPREANLQMINRLRQFGVPVGYSGHDVGITIPLIAASMGANIIEKHLTLDMRQEGPDHKVSLEPYAFKRLVRDIRVADQAMGRETKRYLLRGEVLNRELFAKSLVAARDIEIGDPIKDEDVQIRGPGKGLSPDKREQLIGLAANRAIAKGDFFIVEDIEEQVLKKRSFTFKGDWGLIARFTDYQQMLAYSPRVIEFHLAEKDFDIEFKPNEKVDCKLVVHAPEYLGEELMDLCSQCERIRKASVQLVIKTIELTCSLQNSFKDTPKVIAHPGAMSLLEKLNKSVLRNNLARSIDEIREATKNCGVELLLENLPPYPWYFGGQWKGNYFMDAKEIASFCEDYGVSLCFDLSHSALYCNAKDIELAEEIKILLLHTSHLHLADGYGLDGEGVQFEDGDIDLDKIIPLFKPFKGTWVPEVWRGHLDEGKGFVTALNYLEKFVL